ncbi:HSF-type DNA-binding-domain-containing protein [Coprinopsis sp. MPI-PUGE-AT-0042]|nr:HSF-type DNA-binding-domain-containing protein [Coprinopsis sp. MPI-PUGE-AT-0042]
MSSPEDSKGLKCGPTGCHHRDDSWPSTSDFVRKLFKCISLSSICGVLIACGIDPLFDAGYHRCNSPAASRSIWSRDMGKRGWGYSGYSRRSRSPAYLSWSKRRLFRYQKRERVLETILPRLYNHSNFASFVRQLNKYDFHKIKNRDGNTFDEHSWAFCHPHFLADRREGLENIKRKGPTQRVTQAAHAAAAVAIVQQQQQRRLSLAAAPTIGSLTSDVLRLLDDNEDLKRRLKVGFQQAIVQRGDFVQSVTAHLLDANSCGQRSPRDDNGEYAPSQPTSYFIPQQHQTGNPVPFPYSPQSQQSEYSSSSDYRSPTGGPLTRSSDVPVKDMTNCCSMKLSTSNRLESPSSPISYWNFPPPNVYPANPGCRNGAPLSGPSGEDLGNVGMSLGGRVRRGTTLGWAA